MVQVITWSSARLRFFFLFFSSSFSVLSIFLDDGVESDNKALRRAGACHTSSQFSSGQMFECLASILFFFFLSSILYIFLDEKNRRIESDSRYGVTDTSTQLTAD
ncbi:hypothetical protein F4777DRAFT_568233 [Nemania sp. FL0916]|nr:hypothetical protein F4777DRAFT_568233 [Nemania sp. FL0916]